MGLGRAASPWRRKRGLLGAFALVFVFGVVVFFRGEDLSPISESRSFQRSLTGRTILWLSSKPDDTDRANRAVDTGDYYQYQDYYSVDNVSNNTDGGNGSDCKKPLHSHANYNTSCQYVQANCGDVATLFDYLSLAACKLPHATWLAYIIMAVWLLVLVSLLATTADYFFVPPLTVLANKLSLTPAIAGITLLAVGNGAPDVFSAYAAIHGADDFPLQLSALLGASIFISTVVLGAVMLVADVSAKTINRVDMVRDIAVYMVVVGTVIGVSLDSKIELWESSLFLAIYVLYIAIVVTISFIKRSFVKHKVLVNETTPLVNEISTASDENSTRLDQDGHMVEDEDEEDPDELPGLTWPAKSHIGVKIQFVIEYPFSWLRWITTPPCDNRWNLQRRIFAIVFPIPAGFILVIAALGFDFAHAVPFAKQFNTTDMAGCHHCLPVYTLVFIFGAPLTLGLVFWTAGRQQMDGLLQAFLSFCAFIMSVAWMNIEANEVVSLLETLGLVMGVDTAILGLTVLAIGNSVGDLVADTTVARKTPAMGVSSCFGSPLLNDVLGLGISLTAYTATHYPKPFTFDVNTPSFTKVKLSWIFLGFSLVASLAVFVFTKFSPPRWYAYCLFVLYAIFMVVSVLNESLGFSL